MFISNILNSFYEYTFIILQTINTSIYLEFRVFDTIFNYLKYLKKKKKKKKIFFLKNIVFKICNKVSTKLAKYYLKTKKLIFINCKIKEKTIILLITKTNTR